jgi:hypothetical protein
MTLELRSAINAQLRRLRAINPEIPPEPGGPGTFGNYEKRAPGRPEEVGPTCHLTRPCECEEA